MTNAMAIPGNFGRVCFMSKAQRDPFTPLGHVPDIDEGMQKSATGLSSIRDIPASCNDTGVAKAKAMLVAKEAKPPNCHIVR